MVSAQERIVAREAVGAKTVGRFRIKPDAKRAVSWTVPRSRRQHAVAEGITSERARQFARCER
jgi:hypothetical protein